ncbi:14038_t:CDS:2 [Funneliformis geosporum]|uniref:10862_t:CDS:1 n=1 Tax=Funneliformis geosporum TaxID=1117311 RepID=A0A9W4SMY5_9GLOM|nr:14038_t:CDS:2 [Funneliformis geosporum]CAI2175279.1 10862_t:CDS:2 [Funneliformis geosporum]
MGSLDEKSDEKPFLPAPATSASAYAHRQKQHSATVILLVVAFYWLASLAVVFLNKYILSSSEYKFPYPLFVTWFQLFVALIILLVWGTLGQSPIDVYVRYDVVFQQLMLTICRGYILSAKTSFAALICCGVVFLGFVIGSYGEINFSWEGIIYGVASSAFVALYGIYVKKTLSAVDNNQWRLLHYNTTLSIFFLFPLVLFSGELQGIVNVYFLDDWGFWTLMTITGITGFVINIAMFLQIKFTTPLTNTISGTAKSCFQTALAAWYFQNPISPLNGTGIFLALFGSGLYSWVRYKEMLRK